MPLPDSCPDCEEREAALLELRSGLAYIRLLVADLRLRLALKAGFNPDQPRDDHGRWTDAGGGDRVAQVDEPDRYRVDLLEEERNGGIRSPGTSGSPLISLLAMSATRFWLIPTRRGTTFAADRSRRWRLPTSWSTRRSPVTAISLAVW